MTSILQDSRGFMWFGTEDGLNKYDGYTFTVYRRDPDDPQSLRDDSITTLYEDPAGALWVGTEAGWLERYDQDTDQFVHYSFDSSPILALYQDEDGRLWVATWSAICTLDRDAEEPSIAFTGVRANTIYQDGDGVLWFGAYDGWLYFLDRDGNRLRPVPTSIPVENHSLTSIVEDQTGALWVGRDGGGLSRSDDERQQFVHYRHDPNEPGSLADDSISSIYEDQGGTLWIGTAGGGLDQLDPETGLFIHYQYAPGDPYSLSDNAILSLYQDRSGVLWIGTLTGGLNKLDLVEGNVYHYRSIPNEPNSLGGNVVLAIQQDREGTLWIGTPNGLDRFDRERGVWQHYRHDADDPTSLSHNLVWAILEDGSGTLWIGTQAGLDVLVGATEGGQDARFMHYALAAQDFASFDPAIRSLLEDESGTLWAASSSDLYRFERDTGRFDHVWAIGQTLSWEPARQGYSWKPSLLQDRTGALWVGTREDGLYRLDGQELTQFRADPDDPHSLSDNSVSALLEDESGGLWIGTGSGLDRFDNGTEAFTHFRVKDGLPSNDVRSILEGDVPPDGMTSYLWLATAGGLSRFDPRGETFQNFDVTDGLQGSEFSAGAAYEGRDGELFFGGTNGFNAFYPGEIAANGYAPPVVIVSFRVFGEVVQRDLVQDEQFELSYQENSLSFEFAALDYHAPGKNQYAYTMEGLDSDWVYAGSRRYIEYRDLQPGTYVFRVKGSNNAAVWSEQEAAVRVSIAPPFWGTWWFRGLIGLALLGVVFGAYRVRVRGMRARSRELEKQVDERTAELQREIEGRIRAEAALQESERMKAVVAERNRIARDLHDSVTQSLYAVTLYADAASKRLSSEQVEAAAENLRKLGRTAKDAMGEMRLLIFELRPPVLDEGGLLKALQARLDTVERRSGLKTEFHLEGTGQLPCDVEDGFYRIALEALNNIVRHAHASRVTLSLYHGSKDAALQITDDGVGFDPHIGSNRGGMGLIGMAERAEQFGGRFTVDSEPGQGTVIRVDWKEEE